MGNDGQERVDGEGEGPAPRSTEKIVLRDYDRIQERAPFQLKPVHLKAAAAGALLLVAAGVFTGWLIGRSAGSPEAVKKVEMSAGIAADVAEASAGTGTSRAADTVEAGRSKRNVTGSILPLPSPQPRGPVDAPTGRRPAVEIVEPPPPPVPEFLDWSFWPGLLVTTCEFSCISADGDCRPEDLPPVQQAAVAPEMPEPAPEIVETAPEVAEPSPDAAVARPAETETAADTMEKRQEPVQPKPEPVTQKSQPKPVETRPKATSEAPKKVIKPPEAPPRKFTVQIRSFKDEAAAKEFADQIRGKGYNPFIVQFADAAGTTWFRVRTGSFETAADAAAFAAELNTKESEQSIPMEVK